MKHLFNAMKGSAPIQKASIGTVFILIGFLITSCNKLDHFLKHDKDKDDKDYFMKTDEEFRKKHKGLGNQTMAELVLVRAATEKYKDIQKAIDDGYADISVVVPNMGHHYMKNTLSDGTFDISKPEILVYNKNHQEKFDLVAAEYAVPIELTPDKAPEGFTGNGDVWDRNTGFGLWLLHAWVWHYNPDGVFNPTNPLVHLH